MQAETSLQGFKVFGVLGQFSEQSHLDGAEQNLGGPEAGTDLQDVVGLWFTHMDSPSGSCRILHEVTKVPFTGRTPPGLSATQMVLGKTIALKSEKWGIARDEGGRGGGRSRTGEGRRGLGGTGGRRSESFADSYREGFMTKMRLADLIYPR